MLEARDIAGFLGRQPHVLEPLAAVEALGLDDCWIGAGLIRNAVWDHLHNLPPGPVPGSDVDVVFFNPHNPSPAPDLSIEHRLCAEHPHVPRSVRNQARKHGPNGDPPYRSTADAIRCWPETATAIAARARHGTIELLAPHGIEDLIGLVVRPTPAFAQKMEIYRARQTAKQWAVRWPKLKFLDA